MKGDSSKEFTPNEKGWLAAGATRLSMTPSYKLLVENG
jgi:hypothetical protein